MAELSYSEKPHPDQLFALREAAERLYDHVRPEFFRLHHTSQYLFDTAGESELGSTASFVSLAVDSERIDRSPGLHALWLLVLTHRYKSRHESAQYSTLLQVTHEFRWNNFATYCAERTVKVSGQYTRHKDLYSHLDTVDQIDKNHQLFDFAYGPQLELGRVSAADVVLLQDDVELLIAEDKRVRQAKQGSMRV